LWCSRLIQEGVCDLQGGCGDGEGCGGQEGGHNLEVNVIVVERELLRAMESDCDSFVASL
jgi:hypothetical protein